MTPSIYKILQKSQWWDAYKCSVSEKEALDNPYFVMQVEFLFPWHLCLHFSLFEVSVVTLFIFPQQMSKLAVKQWHKQPFSNSVMGRELSILGLADSSYKQLVVATSHLESPCPAPPSFNQMFSKERKEQLKESLGALQPMKNVVFLGDMNWNEKNDGSPPLGVDWMDAWMQTNPDKVHLLNPLFFPFFAFCLKLTLGSCLILLLCETLRKGLLMTAKPTRCWREGG